jgi:hypothetical protein
VILCPATRDNPAKRAEDPNIAGLGKGTADMPHLRRRLSIIGYSGDGTPHYIPRGEQMAASYAMNEWLVYYTGIDLEFRYGRDFPRESDVSHPSRTPVFGDSVDSYVQPLEDESPVEDLYYGRNLNSALSPASASLMMIARHGGRATARSSLPVAPGQSLAPYVNHVAFFDGHVEKVPLDDLRELYWHRNWQPPGAPGQ